LYGNAARFLIVRIFNANPAVLQIFCENPDQFSWSVVLAAGYGTAGSVTLLYRQVVYFQKDTETTFVS